MQLDSGSLIQRIFRIISILALVLAAVISTRNASASVWNITQDWTPEKEKEFGEWFHQMTAQSATVDGKIPSRFFEQGEPLHGVPVDCADFAYAVRVIFAAQNGLPFSSKVAHGGRRLDASRNHWDSIPKEKRLRAFLEDIIAGTGTWSLPMDTVPITQISRDLITSGTILLASKAVGHVWMIRNVRATGIPELVFASVPALEELFYRDGLPRGEAVFAKLEPGTNQAGFRSFCIPGKSCLSSGTLAESPSTTSPVLSWRRHQDWRPMVLKRLEVRPEPLIESIGREIVNICREGKARASLAHLAYKTKISKNICLRGSDYYNYSTNNRDARMKEGFLDLWELWMTTNSLLDEARDSGRGLGRPLVHVMDQISQIFSDGVIDESLEDIVCPIQIDSDKSISLRDLRQLTIAGRLSPDPNESILARWGLEPERGLCLTSRD